MSRSKLIFLFLICVCLSLNAQSYQFLNAKGQAIGEELFIDFKHYPKEYIPVKKETGWGILSIYDGVIVECIYDEVKLGKITQDVFAVKKDNQWGVVNAEGEVLLPIQYEEIKHFDDEIAIVSIDFYWVMINYDEKKLVDGNYENISNIDAKEAIWFIKNNRYELFARSGKKLTSQSFEYMDEFGRYRMVTNGWHKTGVIDTETGKIVVPLKYDQVYVLNDQLVEIAKSKIKYNDYGPRPKKQDFAYGVYSIPLKKEVVPVTFDRIGANKKYIQGTMGGDIDNSNFYDYQGKGLDPAKLPSVAGVEQFGFQEIVPISNTAFAVKNQRNNRGVVTYKDNTLKWVASPRGYFRKVENIKVENVYFPFALFIGYNYTEVYDEDGKMIHRTKYPGMEKIKTTPSSVIYKNYHADNGETIYLEFTKDGKLNIKPSVAEDHSAIIFKNAEGKYGLQKSDGTVVIPAVHEKIEMKEIGETKIFIIKK